VRIGKLFHLTMLVDEFEGPERFLNSVFSPLCTMRGYSSHWHRHAAIYVIAETSIEPMHVLPPRDGEEATSWYRFMKRHGPRVHNLAFYVDDAETVAARLEGAGVRTTRAGSGSTVFAHPKDTPGMLEFSPSSTMLPEPRFARSWDEFRREYWPNHPLGLVGMSHVTTLVADLEQAWQFYTGVLDATPLPGNAPTLEGTDARHVLVGEDTIVELAFPLDDTSPLGRELQDVGQGVVAATFRVRDVAAAERHLKAWEAPVVEAVGESVILDRGATWGLEFRFTDAQLLGDPRT
jgi:4-hydroxyphenylpyruvate dioxygenase-like putative hemolysin